MKKSIILIIILTAILTKAQVNFEPVNNSVYNFLQRMSLKGIIQLNEEIQPYSRKYIASKIIEIVKKQSKHTSLENDELRFYIREYSSELSMEGLDLSKYKAKKKIIDLKSDNFGFDKYNRFRLFSYYTDQFKLFLDPVFSYNLAKEKNSNSTLWSNGLRLYGSIGMNIGFDLRFYDNHASGTYNTDRKFSSKTGYEFRVGKNGGLDFDRMNANLTFSWDWGNFTIGKDFNYYGSGEDGKIILSNKAPSFPQIKLVVNPVKWFRFSYIHGLLNSQLLDSSTFRFSPERNHISTVEKYFVAHMLSITPFNFLNVSLGESVVFSDRYQPIYLIPIAFFRLADHYLTDPDENAGNAQIFTSAWYKNYAFRTKIYGSIFIDELSLSNSDFPQAIGYNLGFKTIDPLIPESELTFEYTRINPFVYSHADSAQSYANYGYELGHWIGSNADDFFVSFRKRFVRGLNLDLWYRFIRKGSEEDIAKPRYQVDQTFLWGTVNKITMYGASINYELIHSLNIIAAYEYSSSTGGSNYLLNPGSIFKFSMNFGL